MVKDHRNYEESRTRRTECLGTAPLEHLNLIPMDGDPLFCSRGLHPSLLQPGSKVDECIELFGNIFLWKQCSFYLGIDFPSADFISKQTLSTELTFY